MNRKYKRIAKKISEKLEKFFFNYCCYLFIFGLPIYYIILGSLGIAESMYSWISWFLILIPIVILVSPLFFSIIFNLISIDYEKVKKLIEKEEREKGEKKIQEYLTQREIEKQREERIRGEKARQKNLKMSRYIPQEVKREVWKRDQGRCAECGSKERLEFDHIIPFSKGGSNSARNIQLLCEKCNRNKYDKI